MHGASDSESDSDVQMVEPATIHSDLIYEEENEESSIGQPQAKTSKTAEYQDQLQKKLLQATKLVLTTSGRWEDLGRRSFACLFV